MTVDGEDASSVYMHERSGTPLDTSKVLQFCKSLSTFVPSSSSNTIVEQFGGGRR